MWVLDLLREDFPSARIMTYGYPANLDGYTSRNGLRTLARGLIDSLHNLGENMESHAPNGVNDELGTIPLIFISHSLGGLIIKQVFLLTLLYYLA
jgi:hypothetical protein